jgi:UrcA family protein
MSNRFVSLAAGLIVMALPVSAAFAEGATGELVVRGVTPAGVELRAESVKTGDLDLGKPEGAETLLGRIRVAAREVCSPLPSRAADIANVSDYDKCMTHAMDHAVERAHNPALDALYSRVR